MNHGKMGKMISPLEERKRESVMSARVLFGGNL